MLTTFSQLAALAKG